MAHIEANTFIGTFISATQPFYPHPRVLEIGSYDVNGSVRSNFKNAKEYIGVDLISGPSVDVISKGHLYRNPIKFDIVLSVESFEHNCDWIDTFRNMVQLADKNGMVLFTCAAKGRLEHGTYRTDPHSSPGTASEENSYYRNLGKDDFLQIFNFNDYFVSYDFYINYITKDLYFYGLKGQSKLEIGASKLFFKAAYESSMKIRKKTDFKSYLKIRSFYFLLLPIYFFTKNIITKLLFELQSLT
jgi:SAM-dependent methyltransferase